MWNNVIIPKAEKQIGRDRINPFIRVKKGGYINFSQCKWIEKDISEHHPGALT